MPSTIRCLILYSWWQLGTGFRSFFVANSASWSNCGSGTMVWTVSAPGLHELIPIAYAARASMGSAESESTVRPSHGPPMYSTIYLWSYIAGVARAWEVFGRSPLGNRRKLEAPPGFEPGMADLQSCMYTIVDYGTLSKTRSKRHFSAPNHSLVHYSVAAALS
jgi:hypothetical protein